MQTNLFYPCMRDRTGRIRARMSAAKMSREECEQWLRTYAPSKWRELEAIPVATSTPGLCDSHYLISLNNIRSSHHAKH